MKKTQNFRWTILEVKPKNMSNKIFEEQHVLHELKHYLPTQQALKDFIHHNSLHAFQHMKFYDAINKASKIFGFQVSIELKDFRELYKTKRIREDILDKINLKGLKSLSSDEISFLDSYSKS